MPLQCNVTYGLSAVRHSLEDGLSVLAISAADQILRLLDLDCLSAAGNHLQAEIQDTHHIVTR